MLTTIISAIIALGATLALYLAAGWHLAWSIILGLLLGIIIHAAVAWLLSRKVKRLMNEVQATLLGGQKQLQTKMNQWQVRPPGSLKQAQLEIEKGQRTFLQQALQQTEAFAPFYLWSPLLKRQVNTLKMQLYYQMKEFVEVDRLLPRCLYLDPMTAAMRLARMYQRKEEGLEKFFERQIARLRYGQGAVLYSLYAWIAVKRGDLELAHKTLLRATKKMEHETIKRNIEHLANNRPKQFNNSGLGDEWYALGLEEPRIKTQRQRNPGGRHL